MAPENWLTQSALRATNNASMRPGLDGPGKPLASPDKDQVKPCFNEAGAGWPRKTYTRLMTQVQYG